MSSDPLFKNISTFEVGDFITWISDHCPVLYSLEISNQPNESIIGKQDKPAPKQYIWSEESINKFKLSLENRLKWKTWNLLIFQIPANRLTT